MNQLCLVIKDEAEQYAIKLKKTNPGLDWTDFLTAIDEYLEERFGWDEMYQDIELSGCYESQELYTNWYLN